MTIKIEQGQGKALTIPAEKHAEVLQALPTVLENNAVALGVFLIPCQKTVNHSGIPIAEAVAEKRDIGGEDADKFVVARKLQKKAEKLQKNLRDMASTMREMGYAG